jgi:hypothetical protein
VRLSQPPPWSDVKVRDLSFFSPMGYSGQEKTDDRRTGDDDVAATAVIGKRSPVGTVECSKNDVF